MKRAALSANIVEFPARPRSTILEVVEGRQRVLRRGIFFSVVGGHRRAVYMQLDGKIILADECKCTVDWPDEGGLAILSGPDCPIDEHQIRRRHERREEE